MQVGVPVGYLRPHNVLAAQMRLGTDVGLWFVVGLDQSKTIY